MWLWHGAQIPTNICKAAVIAAQQRDAGRGGDLEPNALLNSRFAPEWLRLRALLSHPWLRGGPGGDMNTEMVSLADQSRGYCRNRNRRQWWGVAVVLWLRS